MRCWMYAERSLQEAGVLSKKDGSSEGILERISFGGSFGRYAKCSSESEAIWSKSWPKQSKLESRFLLERVYKEFIDMDIPRFTITF